MKTSTAAKLQKCPTCGKTLGYKSSQKYCSLECYSWRNLPPRDELLKELNRTHNVNLTAQLFGVNKQALYNWMRKHEIKKILMYV